MPRKSFAEKLSKISGGDGDIDRRLISICLRYRIIPIKSKDLVDVFINAAGRIQEGPARGAALSRILRGSIFDRKKQKWSKQELTPLDLKKVCSWLESLKIVNPSNRVLYHADIDFIVERLRFFSEMIQNLSRIPLSRRNPKCGPIENIPLAISKNKSHVVVALYEKLKDRIENPGKLKSGKSDVPGRIARAISEMMSFYRMPITRQAILKILPQDF